MRVIPFWAWRQRFRRIWMSAEYALSRRYHLTGFRSSMPQPRLQIRFVSFRELQRALPPHASPPEFARGTTYEQRQAVYRCLGIHGRLLVPSYWWWQDVTAATHVFPEPPHLSFAEF